MTPSTDTVAPGPLRLGTRASALALVQSRWVARALEAAHPGLVVELVPLSTRGDRTPGPLAPLGGKGLFTAELEAGLVDGSLDLAVHSLKDLPVTLDERLAIAAYPERADPRDALICHQGGDPGALPDGSVILTGALRRRAQLLAAHPGLAVEGLRGNVGTRLARWRERDGAEGRSEHGAAACGVILAAAGLDRLEADSEAAPGASPEAGGLPVPLAELPLHRLDPERFVPAPGQGTLAVQVLAGSRAEALCRALHHEATARAADAERRVVAAFDGNCALPLAAWARPAAGGDPGRLTLTALVATPDGRRLARAEATAASPEEVAGAVVEELRRRDAAAILREVSP